MARRAARRLDAAVVADLRALPFADRSIGGIVAFYSLIHVRRPELAGALQRGPPGAAARAAGCSSRRTRVSARPSVEEFLGRPAPIAATMFTLDELVTATTDAALDITRAERRGRTPTRDRRRGSTSRPVDHLR